MHNTEYIELSASVPSISVIVCTFNRSTYLRKALYSLMHQTITESLYEIIVVDNCSSDDTSQVVREEFPHFSRIHYIFEPQPGLSFARNTGCISAKGNYLTFIDDDAVAEPDWLEKILDIYKKYPDACVVGGKIDLLFDGKVPPWIHEDFLGFLGKLEYGNEVKEVHLSERLGGGNFSIKKQVLINLGYFSTLLGRSQVGFLSGEETELMARVQAWGGKCYYTPFAVVHHHVQPNRLLKSFYLQRSYWQGYSDSIQRYMNKMTPPGISLVALYGIKLCIRSVSWLILFPIGNIADRFRRMCMVKSAYGAFSHSLMHLKHSCSCYAPCQQNH